MTLRILGDRYVHDPALPGGRTLHLVDVENLAGEARPSDATVQAVLERYRHAVPLRDGDHVVVAANRATAAAAGWAWPGVLVRSASGPDGADLALLAEAEVAEVTRRFDRVIVASGDHAFAERASELRAAGVVVEVVARPRSLARALREAVDVVRLLAPSPAQAVAA